MTDRHDALTYALAELISAHKVISNTPDLTTDDKDNILNPLSDSISDCEYMLRETSDDQPDTMERDERKAYLGGVT